STDLSSTSMTTTPTDSTPFAALDLPRPPVRALEKDGMTDAFAIQAATLPDALARRDVLGRAQTGSAKTLACGLGRLARPAARRARPQRPRGLVPVPTRELARQGAEGVIPRPTALGLWCRPAVGGMAFNRQADALSPGVDLLSASPGRLSD